jgi:DMSO/TMAO reductase YedYZ molybdopterin-dependent catalytic subunit
MPDFFAFLGEHRLLSRRYFLKVGGAGLVASGFAGATNLRSSLAQQPAEAPAKRVAVELGEAVKTGQPLITSQDRFFDVSRGSPIPHTLPEDGKRAVGMTRDTWKLEVISDPENPVKLRRSFSKEQNSALDFTALMQLAEKHAVRFAKAMTCLNLGCPLGFGIWEGVPLRKVIWQTEPNEKLRRVFYYGYHNDKPEQMFRSSLPIGRVFEDPFDLPPVILCYKLNGQWLTPERGGPVRVVVPEAYGFKSIKWLTHVVLTNLAHANDTYANDGNDVDSPLKTFAATIGYPTEIAAGEKIPISGYAQVGISGLSKVQAWISSDDEQLPAGDRHYLQAPWTDMEILAPPTRWGDELPDGKIPESTLGFDPQTGTPRAWPMRLTMVHWAGLLPGIPAGKYTLRCRTIDEKGIPQPLPRPLRKSGHNAITHVSITVKP